MAVVSRELIWRLRSVEQACNRQFLDVWASVEGNPMKAEYQEHPWGTIMHFSKNPDNSVFNRAAAAQEGMFDHIAEIASQSANNMEAFGFRMATELWHWRKAGK